MVLIILKSKLNFKFMNPEDYLYLVFSELCVEFLFLAFIFNIGTH